MNYRKDIQILRGISVLFVVLYHFNLGILESGFLGVDIFFVISGFLMANLYQGSTTSFYLKRAKRLLPAYIVTIFLTLIACYFITLPNDFDQVRIQANFASLLNSNTGYWLENSYFSKANFTPLLHLWSLGVELQFYLLVPFLFPLLEKSKSLVIIIFLASISTCFLITEVSPKTSFFMMPTRIWEFLLGFIAAKYLTNNGNIKYKANNTIKILISLPILAIPFLSTKGDIQNFIFGHPGLTSLTIGLAAAAILTLGLPAKKGLSKINYPLEKLGKYSYSIYLSHFPILALYTYQPFSGSSITVNSMEDLIYLVLTITFVSIGLFKLVEEKSINIKHLYKGLIASPIVLITLSSSLSLLQKHNYNDKENAIFDSMNDRDIYRCGKLFRVFNPRSDVCSINNITDKNADGVLLIGNSHADAIKQVFSKLTRQEGLNLYITTSNNPLAINGLNPKQIVELAKANNTRKIVLHYSPNSTIKIDSIIKLLKEASQDSINIFYLMPIPVWKTSVPKILWEDLPSYPTTAHNNYNITNHELLTALQKIDSDNFKIIHTYSTFCENSLCKIANKEGKPLYFDSNHLTLTGSKYLKPLLHEIITH